ncbi:MAG: hypothetical protein GY795_06900 [Desulfobacterales bacterium]|nr:hypothetical protein [Desulfobacterales bacterium]
MDSRVPRKNIIIIFQVAIVFLMSAFLSLAGAQDQNSDIIASVIPSAAARGTANLSVAINLADLGSPPLPPQDSNPKSVKIGALEGSNINRTNLVITAVFTIPDTEPVGAKDVILVFPGSDGDVVFTESAGFTVNTGSGQTGSLQVDIAPQEAADAGAQWNVDNGAWQNSASIVSGLAEGSHIVSYKAGQGWTVPSEQPVNINAGALTKITGTYTPEQSEPGWAPLIVERFDSGINPPWSFSTNMDGITWTTTSDRYDKANPNSTHSAKAVSEETGYPAGLETWMIYGPVNMSGKTGAELVFSHLEDMGTDARLGVCIGTVSDASSLSQGDCRWYPQASAMWHYERIDLAQYTDQPEIYFGWVFDGGTGDASKPGAFVDEIQIWTNQDTVTPSQDYGWKMLYKESFGNIVLDTAPLWTLFTNQEGKEWTATDQQYDNSDPDEPKSAAAVPHTGYSSGLENRMVFGPLDLGGQKSSEMFFSYYLDGEESDWLAFCTGNDPNQTDFSDKNCFWFNGSTGGWRHEHRDLTQYAGQSDLYLTWYFNSEAGSDTKTGMFIDRIEVLGTDQDAPPMFDFSGDFAQWETLFSEPFDSTDMYSDPKWTSATNQTGINWKTTSQNYDNSNPDSAKSAGISPSGTGYPKELRAWMIYGPIDISKVESAEVKFSIYYDTVFSADENPGNDDRLGFFVTPAKSPQDIPSMLEKFPKIRWWAGTSDNNAWENAHEDLTPFTGHQDIYLAWFFESNVGSASKPGAFVDEITVTSQAEGAETPKVDFEADGLRNENGGFDRNNLYDWDFKDPGPGDGEVMMKEKKDNYYPAISGNQIMYQVFDIDTDLNDLYVSFSYAAESEETTRGNDQFCVALTSADDPDNLIVDFGCWDVVDFPSFAKISEETMTWGRFEESLTDEEIGAVTQTGGTRIGFTVILEQDSAETGNTVLFLDDVNVYSTGFTRRSTDDDSQAGFASQRDPSEPNDTFETATFLNCGQTREGLFGDVGGIADTDYYKLVRVPSGEFVIDINARTKTPGSAADTYVELFDKNRNLLDSNDDDGESLDSEISFDNQDAKGVYYIKIKTAHGGGPDFFYDMTITCGQSLSRDRSETREVKTGRHPVLAGKKSSRKASAITGDINGDDQVDLSDIILILQILADVPDALAVNIDADADGDSQIGFQEAVFALQTVSEIRETESSDDTWTMILYLDAEDQSCVDADNESLCWTGIFEESIRRIEEYIGEKQDFLNVIALVDGPNFNDVSSDVTRYAVQPDGVYTEDTNKWILDEINMGDPDVLADFVTWAMSGYPADHYYLAIHDHGHGIFGTAWDYHDADGEAIDDYLTPAEIRSALKDVTNNGETKIDIFEYQSCLMGLLENAYGIKDYTDYVALFQPVSWTSYNYPEYFRELQQGDSSLGVGKQIIQNYPVSDESYPYTFSLIDTSKLTTVREKLDIFAEALMDADIDKINTARNESQAFNGNVNKGDPSQDIIGYIDLWYISDRIAARGIASSEASELKAAIEAAVVESKATEKGGDPLWDYSDFHGLSILYPMAALTLIEDYKENYAMSTDGKWDEFLTGKVFPDYESRRSGEGRGQNITNMLEKSGLVDSVLK